jgi:hypothetical protein
MRRLVLVISFVFPVLVLGKPVTIKVTKEMCDTLIVDHVPNDDVNYKEGVDVNGNKVVPATLNSSGLGSAIADKIKKEGVKIELYAHIKPFTNFPPAPVGSADYLGIVVSASKAALGYLTIKNGEVFLDGKPLEDDVTSKIKKECMKLKTKKSP